ncbi:DUF493 domain-containing protein [Marinoscillum luteum]|jgi:uncharacterized protein|uniref:DUF493 domain-containing protein n=1 Tax=Marinoscillum luteum TaxID=861051 RepID=A0ABW7N8S8_9BACT
MSWDVESFREKVELQHNFPGYYTFKFIVPVDKKSEILDLIPPGEVSFKESSGKNYISITAKTKLETSQAVLDVYIAANQVEGCFAL